MSFIKNKKYFFFFTFLILSIIPLPFLSYAGASWWDWVPGANTIADGFGIIMIRVPAFVLSIIFLGLLFLAQILAFITRAILMLVLSPYFIGWSYTNPSGPNANPIIYEGLMTTQSLVNMILVLALIFIGIVTILGLENYNTKKLLINFIIVALLVNFAPVICGIIIDASNILMNYFVVQISPGVGGALGTLSDIFMEKTVGLREFSTLWQQATDASVTTIVSTTISYLSLIFVYLGFALGYLLFSVLFLARYMIIWLLVILSPLAFASYAIPQTKHLADKWWNIFTQWAFIGVTGGFFLYLAEKFALLSWAPTQSILNDRVQGLGEWNLLIRNIIQGTMPAIFSLFLMYIGLMMALAVNPIGAQQAINMGKKAGKGTLSGAKWAGQKTGINQRTGRLMSNMSSYQADPSTILGKAQKGVWAAGNTVTLGGLGGLNRAFGRLGQRIETKSIAEDQKKLKESEAKMRELHKTNPGTVESISKSKSAIKEDRMAAAVVVASEDKLDTSNKNQVEAYKQAVKSGAFDVKKAENSNPSLVKYNESAINEAGGSIEEARKRVVKRQSASQLSENLSVDALQDINTIVSIDAKVISNPKFKENLSAEKKDKLKEYGVLGSPKFREFEQKINDAIAAGNTQLENELVDLLAEIQAL